MRGWQPPCVLSSEAEELSFQNHLSATPPPRKRLKYIYIKKIFMPKHRACLSFHDATQARCCSINTLTCKRISHAHTHTMGFPLSRGPDHLYMSKSYLDPNITVGSQGRVVQTSRGSFTNHPLEGCCGPEDDVPPKFQQGYDGAKSTITVD